MILFAYFENIIAEQYQLPSHFKLSYSTNALQKSN